MSGLAASGRLEFDEAKHIIVPSSQVDLTVVERSPKVLCHEEVSQAPKIKIRFHFAQSSCADMPSVSAPHVL
jgi:hypothetical protein